MFDYETLKFLWWGLIGFLFIGFAITDGMEVMNPLAVPVASVEVPSALKSADAAAEAVVAETARTIDDVIVYSNFIFL